MNKKSAHGLSKFYSEGLRFECKRCSACCRYEEGYVFLSEEDAAALVKRLETGYTEFRKIYCRWIPAGEGRAMLSLREKANLDCIFWKEGIGCAVYEDRPLQCRAFPFWPRIAGDASAWKTAAKNCPGMGKGSVHSPEEIEDWLEKQRLNPVITKGNL